MGLKLYETAWEMPYHLIRSALKRTLQRTTSGRYRAFQNARYHNTKRSKPLRILFCGSDKFSGVSLRALYNEQQQNPVLIKSIDVLCRPGKRAGRYLKRIREVPIKAIAEQLGLPVHERDTFKGWELPRREDEAINLIIAVSFGLFIPSRILKAAEYGGLNVHPSLLPQFRGPAPIQHTIMNGHLRTGITLQTLDDKSFDNGMILAQTPGDGVLIPQESECTFPVLLNFVSDLGAKMLVQGLRDGVHVPPLQHKGRILSKEEKENLIHASKITSNDRYMPFGLNAPTTATRLERALGRVWCNVWIDDETQKRLTFEGLKEENTPTFLSKVIETNKIKSGKGSDSTTESILEIDQPEEYQPVYFVVMTRDNGKRRASLYFEDRDDIIVVFPRTCLRVKYITIEGLKQMAAAKAMRSIRQSSVWKLKLGSNFQGPAQSLSEASIDGFYVEPLKNVHRLPSAITKSIAKTAR